ncbi:MAG: hypothetical protein RLZZ276_1864 [Pseudomonadota bacterium]
MKTADERYSGTENLEAMASAVRYNEFIRDLVRSHAPPRAQGDLVVDFGAGIGTFSDIFPARDLLCVEQDPAQRASLQARGLATAGLEEIPGSSVAFIYSINVLEHVVDDGAVLQALRGKLRPGGRLLVYVPAFRILWTDMDDLVGHVRRYRRGELVGRVEAAGLRVLHAEYADSAGFFATLLFKALGRLRGGGGRLSPTAVALFDRMAFPVGRLLDRLLLGRLFGKNVVVVAMRD